MNENNNYTLLNDLLYSNIIYTHCLTVFSFLPHSIYNFHFFINTAFSV